MAKQITSRMAKPPRVAPMITHLWRRDISADCCCDRAAGNVVGIEVGVEVEVGMMVTVVGIMSAVMFPLAVACPVNTVEIFVALKCGGRGRPLGSNGFKSGLSLGSPFGVPLEVLAGSELSGCPLKTRLVDIDGRGPS
jgi:hypothetical protein